MDPMAPPGSATDFIGPTFKRSDICAFLKNWHESKQKTCIHFNFSQLHNTPIDTQLAPFSCGVFRQNGHGVFRQDRNYTTRLQEQLDFGQLYTNITDIRNRFVSQCKRFFCFCYFTRITRKSDISYNSLQNWHRVF